MAKNNHFITPNDSMGQKFWKSLFGCSVSDPLDVSGGTWDWNIYFQDDFFTHMSGASMIFVLSLHMAFHLPGPFHEIWVSHNMMVSGSCTS